MSEEIKTYLVGVATDESFLQPSDGRSRPEPFPRVQALYIVSADNEDDAVAQVEEQVKHVQPGQSIAVAEATEFVVRQRVERLMA